MSYSNTHGPYENFGVPGRICGCCGAQGAQTHNENCTINLPGGFAKLYPIWQHGRNDHIKNGRPDSQAFMLDDKGREAYMMGVNFAKQQISADRTTESLKQAVEIARAL